jgi:hypothetical protein
LQHPGRSDVARSVVKRVQQRVQLVDVRAEVMHAAKRVCDRAQRAGGVTIALCEPSLEALELGSEDAGERITFFREPPQLCFGNPAVWIFQHAAEPFPQCGVEFEPELGHESRAYRACDRHDEEVDGVTFAPISEDLG